jgi:hypothetical protein
MQHEVLLALLGHSGQIIEKSGDSFRVADDVPFLSAAEKEVITRVVCLGSYYNHFADFARSNRTGISLTNFYLSP